MQARKMIDEARVRAVHAKYQTGDANAAELVTELLEAGVPSYIVNLVDDMHGWIIDARQSKKE